MNQVSNPKLAIVIPCFNEAEVLPRIMPEFVNKLNDLVSSKNLSADSYILLVNDGSSDSTWEIIKQFATANKRIHGISLSRNRGHQNALLAGLDTVRKDCDISISMDCDGQDDINATDMMVDEYLKGVELVYACRNSRDTDTWFKKNTAELFYKLVQWMGGDIVFNHADYRLASQRVLNALFEFNEVNLFLRGIFPMIGFKSSKVYYSRNVRLSGESHYPFFKMLSFAVDGITSLSVKPIRLITVFGAIISVLAFGMIIWSLISYCRGIVVPGWTSGVLCVCLLGGIQLLSIGVIGEYIGKIYLESKHRPRYIISERV